MGEIAKDSERGERRASRAQTAIDEIRNMISEGRLRAGDRVNELNIARHLGMSRGPVREAVSRLAHSGLLVEEPHVGARVVMPDAAYMRELFVVRELLESQAAAEAAQCMTDAQIRNLHEVLDRHEERLREVADAPYPTNRKSEDIHQLILAGSRNTLIARICGNDLSDIFLLLRLRSSLRGRQALREHRAIVRAIEERNPEVAALLMKQHIRASHTVFIEIMKQIARRGGTPATAEGAEGSDPDRRGEQ